jgi:hypothetical protein
MEQPRLTLRERKREAVSAKPYMLPQLEHSVAVAVGGPGPWPAGILGVSIHQAPEIGGTTGTHNRSDWITGAPVQSRFPKCSIHGTTYHVLRNENKGIQTFFL